MTTKRVLAETEEVNTDAVDADVETRLQTIEVLLLQIQGHRFEVAPSHGHIHAISFHVAISPFPFRCGHVVTGERAELTLTPTAPMSCSTCDALLLHHVEIKIIHRSSLRNQ